MATKFIKGGLLNTTQLQNLSGKKWKKGGILNAKQLNELSSGSGGEKDLVIIYSDSENEKLTITQNIKDVLSRDTVDNVAVKFVVESSVIDLVPYAIAHHPTYGDALACVSPDSSVIYTIIRQNDSIVATVRTINETPNETTSVEIDPELDESVIPQEQNTGTLPMPSDDIPGSDESEHSA